MNTPSFMTSNKNLLGGKISKVYVKVPPLYFTATSFKIIFKNYGEKNNYIWTNYSGSSRNVIKINRNIEDLKKIYFFSSCLSVPEIREYTVVKENNKYVFKLWRITSDEKNTVEEIEYSYSSFMAPIYIILEKTDGKKELIINSVYATSLKNILCKPNLNKNSIFQTEILYEVAKDLEFNSEKLKENALIKYKTKEFSSYSETKLKPQSIKIQENPRMISDEKVIFYEFKDFDNENNYKNNYSLSIFNNTNKIRNTDEFLFKPFYQTLKFNNSGFYNVYDENVIYVNDFKIKSVECFRIIDCKCFMFLFNFDEEQYTYKIKETYIGGILPNIVTYFYESKFNKTLPVSISLVFVDGKEKLFGYLLIDEDDIHLNQIDNGKINIGYESLTMLYDMKSEKGCFAKEIVDSIYDMDNYQITVPTYNIIKIQEIYSSDIQMARSSNSIRINDTNISNLVNSKKLSFYNGNYFFSGYSESSKSIIIIKNYSNYIKSNTVFNFNTSKNRYEFKVDKKVTENDGIYLEVDNNSILN